MREETYLVKFVVVVLERARRQPEDAQRNDEEDEDNRRDGPGVVAQPVFLLVQLLSEGGQSAGIIISSGTSYTANPDDLFPFVQMSTKLSPTDRSHTFSDTQRLLR